MSDQLISEEINDSAVVSSDATAADETSEATEEERPESADDSESSEESEQEDQPPKKHKGGFQKRIDRLTQEKRYLETVVQQLVGGQQGQPAAQPVQAEKPQGKPDPKNFKDYDEYVENLGRWGAEQRLAEEADRRNRQDAQRHHEEAMQAFEGRQQKARKELKDYDEVIADADDVPMSPAMRAAIVESELGPKVAYHLAKNPAVAKRMAGLSPSAVNREIGRLEATLASARKQPTPISNAPEPIRPVSSKSGNTVKRPLREVTDFAEYEKRRAAGER